MRDELPLPHLADEPWCANGPVVEPIDAKVKVSDFVRAISRCATARTLDAASGTRAVWLGGDANRLLCDGPGLGIRLFPAGASLVAGRGRGP